MSMNKTHVITILHINTLHKSKKLTPELFTLICTKNFDLAVKFNGTSATAKYLQSNGKISFPVTTVTLNCKVVCYTKIFSFYA